MKKTYVNPEMQVLALEVEGFLCLSDEVSLPIIPKAGDPDSSERGETSFWDEN